MAKTTKRKPEDAGEGTSPKKIKLASKPGKKRESAAAQAPAQTPSGPSEEVDFPRGGGTTFTPAEVKTIRAEAQREANDDIFKEAKSPQVKGKKRKSRSGDSSANADDVKRPSGRIEHLNYKRVAVGMKILCQVISVEPLSLIVSLPNQLFGHIPITQISPELTALLEKIDESADEEGEESGDEDDASKSQQKIPDLADIFSPGQYLRAVVTEVHAPGTTDNIGVGRPKDGGQRMSRRVELSVEPHKVNGGIAVKDLTSGFVLSAAVKSVEDHGYILNTGIPDVSGFLSFKETKKIAEVKYRVGQLVDVYVTKLSSNGRTCNFGVDPKNLVSNSITEVYNVTSILPGALVQSLVTTVSDHGLGLQILGYFDGTIDLHHLPTRDPSAQYKIGQKIKARVLYELPATSPPKFALSLADHVLGLQTKQTEGSRISESYPIGAILDNVKIVGVEGEHGVTVEVTPDVTGFIHISHLSDQHVPALAEKSGHWKVGTIHRARVTGYFAFDGYLQLSLRPSVLEKKFLQVSDVAVGEVVKGTVKKLTESALFVSLSGNVDGVVWPIHFADIPLKHPQKRFKPGSSIKCRILVVDPARARIVLTAKRTLVDSEHPIITKPEDAKVGLVTHAVVGKVFEKHLQVEFYNSTKGVVLHREASEGMVGPLTEVFKPGKPVLVRILANDTEKGRILASIRQATISMAPQDISAVEIGDSVSGTISDVHKDNVLLGLETSNIRALLSIKNLANRRGSTTAQLRANLKTGEKLDDLVVVSRNPEQGFVIVATKPTAKPALGAISIDTVQVGQIVGGRVVKHDRRGALVKFNGRITGSLHPTDTSDDYGAGSPFPNVDSVLKAAVIAIDREKKHLTLSTRKSRMEPSEPHVVVDAEIASIEDVKPGTPVRGFIKSVAEHGLFVSIGRDLDARVQIKELFDEYVKEWKPRFQTNQLVKGKILSVDKENRKLEMSFRTKLPPSGKELLTLRDFQKGQIVHGHVKKVEDYGLFVELDDSKVSGLCHKSELSDNKGADVTLALRSFREGDRVKAFITSIDNGKKRISFSLKPSNFGDDEGSGSEVEGSGDESEPEALGVVAAEDDDAEMSDAQEGVEESESSDDEEVDEPMEVDLEPKFAPIEASASTSKPPTITLDVKDGFKWTEEPDEEELSAGSSSDSSEGEQSSKKKRRRKQVELDLTGDMHTRMPESNADFERLLLGSPNSSYLWIQYMSFQIQLSEIDKAREVAQRAFKTINFREEQERLNVWIALLNLENIYGTEQTVEDAFKDAVRRNDAKTVYLGLATIFEQSEKFDKAEEQYKKTVKKFGRSSKAWTRFGEFYLSRGQPEQSRALLPRSLQSLEKHKHLKTISKFAQLEYKLGDPERGKTIFEGIVDSHPKRWDLWSIYIDMTASQDDITGVRSLFDRVFTHKMTSHKAKSFFKKWLDLEKRRGDEEGVEAVKQKAIEWTQKAVNS